MEPEGSFPLSQAPATCPVLSQFSPVFVSQSHLLKIYFSFVLPSIPGSSEWFFPIGLPTKALYSTLFSPTRVLLLDVIIRKINIWWSLIPATDITAIYETNTRGRTYLCIFPTENASITTLSAICVTVAEEILSDVFRRKEWSCKPPVPYFNRKRLHFIFLPTFCTHSMTQ